MIVTRSMKLRAIDKIRKVFTMHCKYDPISLLRIKKKFCIVRNNCQHFYDATVLFNYINSSGDFKDPITRIDFDSCELLRLDHAVQMPSYWIYAKKEELLSKREEYFTIVGLCDFFEIEIMEQISLIRDILLCDDFEFRLQFDIIPMIVHSVDNIRTIHTERCKFTLCNLLKRLTQNPISDRETHAKLCHILKVLLISCDSSANL